MCGTFQVPSSYASRFVRSISGMQCNGLDNQGEEEVPGANPNKFAGVANGIENKAKDTSNGEQAIVVIVSHGLDLAWPMSCTAISASRKDRRRCAGPGRPRGV